MHQALKTPNLDEISSEMHQQQMAEESELWFKEGIQKVDTSITVKSQVTNNVTILRLIFSLW